MFVLYGEGMRGVRGGINLKELGNYSPYQLGWAFWEPGVNAGS
jgi:hypothetical protein